MGLHWNVAERPVPPSARLLSSRWVLPALPAGLCTPPSPAVFCWICFFLAQPSSFSCSGVPHEAPCLRNSAISLQEMLPAGFKNSIQPSAGTPWMGVNGAALHLGSTNVSGQASPLGTLLLFTCIKNLTGPWDSWFLQSLKLPLADFQPQQRKGSLAEHCLLTLPWRLCRQWGGKAWFFSRCKLAPRSSLGMCCCLSVEWRSYAGLISPQRSTTPALPRASKFVLPGKRNS